MPKPKNFKVKSPVQVVYTCPTINKTLVVDMAELTYKPWKKESQFVIDEGVTIKVFCTCLETHELYTYYG